MSDKEIGDPNVQYVEEVETSVVTEEVIFHSKFQNVEEAADGSNPSGASGIVVGNPVTTVVIEEASSAPGKSADGKVVVLPGIVTNTSLLCAFTAYVIVLLTVLCKLYIICIQSREIEVFDGCPSLIQFRLVLWPFFRFVCSNEMPNS